MNIYVCPLKPNFYKPSTNNLCFNHRQTSKHFQNFPANHPENLKSILVFHILPRFKATLTNLILPFNAIKKKIKRISVRSFESFCWDAFHLWCRQKNMLKVIAYFFVIANVVSASNKANKCLW